MKSTKLNLGCGDDIKPGYINVDFEVFSGVDLKIDLNKIPYPFKSNQFTEIFMSNILEHLNDPYQIMNEIHRISKPGAIIKIRTAHFSSNNAWGDLQHKRGFNSETFQNSNMINKFAIVKQKITFSHFRFFMRPLSKLNPIFYEKHLAYIFPAVDLVINLKTKK
jgi:predicted SAM-dependent methyltransferase